MDGLEGWEGGADLTCQLVVSEYVVREVRQCRGEDRRGSIGCFG